MTSENKVLSILDIKKSCSFTPETLEREEIQFNQPLQKNVRSKSKTARKFSKSIGFFDFKLMQNMKLIRDASKGKQILKRIISKIISLEKKKKKKSLKFIENIAEQILQNKICLGSPILSNILNPKRPLNACTIIPLSYRNKTENLSKKFVRYTQCGIGSGFDLDEVDDPCETIEKINTATIKVNEKIFSRGFCSIGTLSVESPHILDYINLKKYRDYSTCHYNISVKISDDFMNKLRKNPINSEILFLIAKSIHYCAEPGLLFMDTFNRNNPTPKYEYKSVSPCAEIAMAEGDVCQFSYINLSKFVKNKIEIDYDSLKDTIKYMTRMLDNFIDITIKNSIDDNPIVANKRRIAIGVCGFADLLAILKIPYDTKEAIILAKNIFSFINYHSKIESVNLAQERGSFPCFKESRYTDESFIERFIDNEVTTVSEDDWKNLAKTVKQKGIRNCATTALPPSGRSSAIIGASYSIEPYFTRKECKYLEGINNEENIIKTATEISPIKHIEMVAAINKLIDDSVSKTVNVSNKTTPEEIFELIIKAHQLGIKGITFFRQRCLEERKVGFVNKGVKGFEKE